MGGGASPCLLLPGAVLGGDALDKGSIAPLGVQLERFADRRPLRSSLGNLNPRGGPARSKRGTVSEGGGGGGV